MNPSHPYIPRFQQTKLKELFRFFPVVVVAGARQVGKSTLLEESFGSDISRVIFDPLIDIENARKDPDLFLKNRPAPLILDEIQYAPELVPALKRQIDKNRKPSQYLITGSQQWEIMKLLAESLAGRVAFIDLEGFAFCELVEAQENQFWLEKWLQFDPQAPHLFQKLSLKKKLYEQIWFGTLPEAQFLPTEIMPDFFQAYVRTYIERDIRLLATIENLPLFTRFYRLCAALTAQEINFSQLGRDLGIKGQTAEKWLSLFKATFQWWEIPAYSGNTVKRISQKPKGFFADTGLACWAQSISSPLAIATHPLWGAIFETLVVTDIRRQCRFLPSPPQLYHWRSHGGAEVDLILEIDGKFFPMEIKSKSHPTRGDARGIQAFRKTYPHLNIQPGLILSAGDSFFQVGEEDYVLPWDMG